MQTVNDLELYQLLTEQDRTAVKHLSHVSSESSAPSSSSQATLNLSLGAVTKRSNKPNILEIRCIEWGGFKKIVKKHMLLWEE